MNQEKAASIVVMNVVLPGMRGELTLSRDTLSAVETLVNGVLTPPTTASNPTFPSPASVLNNITNGNVRSDVDDLFSLGIGMVGEKLFDRVNPGRVNPHTPFLVFSPNGSFGTEVNMVTSFRDLLEYTDKTQVMVQWRGNTNRSNSASHFFLFTVGQARHFFRTGQAS